MFLLELLVLSRQTADLTVKVTVTTSVADNRPGEREPNHTDLCCGCHGDDVQVKVCSK